jgi:hypothetical protein
MRTERIERGRATAIWLLSGMLGVFEPVVIGEITGKRIA